MPTKAKVKKSDVKSAPEKSKERAHLDEKQVVKMFENPKGFLNFLQTLPPHKTVIDPKVAADPTIERNNVIGPNHCIWTALSWYLRDGVGLDRYTDPDHVLGMDVTHYLTDDKQKVQGIRHSGSWVFDLYQSNRIDAHSMSASALAFESREILADLLAS